MPPTLSFFRSSTQVQLGGQGPPPQSPSHSQYQQAQTQQSTAPPPTASMSTSARTITPPSPRSQPPWPFPTSSNPQTNSTNSQSSGIVRSSSPSTSSFATTAATHTNSNQNSGQNSYANPPPPPGRFGSGGSWSRGKKSRFSSVTVGTSTGAGAGGSGSPTRPGYGQDVPGGAGTDDPGSGGGSGKGRRMTSITEGIPSSASSHQPAQTTFSMPGSRDVNTASDWNSSPFPRSASPSRSFPDHHHPANAQTYSHTHHLSLSVAPSGSSTVPPPSPHARPKPRGLSENGNLNGEKRRAGWFAGLVPGGSGGTSNNAGGTATGGVGQEVEPAGRTRRLGSGSSILSNPFSTSARDPDQNSTTASTLPRGSIDEDPTFFSGSAVNRSASFKLGFRNRVSSSSKPGTTTVGGLNISGPIGPMVKASQEEILQEFGRLRTGSEADDPVLREFRSTSLDQGLKLRSSSFTAGDRPNFSSSSLEDKEGVFRLASRVEPTGVPNTAPIQRPVTPERTQLAQMPGTPLAQTRSGSYNGTSQTNMYPTPLSPPARRPTVASRRSGQSPAPFAWPSRGVEAGCLSPRQPARQDSFDVYSSAGEGQGSIYRPASPSESRASPSSVEWLSRKPSSTFDPHTREFALGPVRSIEDRNTKRKPVPLLPRTAEPSQLPHLRQRTSDDSEDHKYSTSGAEADEDSEEQLSSVEDAVITRAERVVSPRKDSFSSTSFSIATTPPRSPALLPRDSKNEFQVETVCVPSTDGETMRWEIVVRRMPSGSSPGSAGVSNASGPVQLSQHRTTTRAPITASSLNLSLSLDRPTGKLAFLSLPTSANDPHATPVRSRAPQPSTSGIARARIDSSPGPSPSPSPSPYNRDSGLGRSASIRPAPESSTITSPTFAPSARAMRPMGDRRQMTSPPMWPNSPLSPGAPITPISPPGSPREVVVRQRRKASLQGGVLYTRTHDNQV